MSLATWGTLFASIGGVVTLLYLLRLRRRKIEVPFGPLWREVLQEKQSTSLFRVLKRWFSLLLQLAFIALILTALADPVWNGSGFLEYKEPREPEPKHTLLVVDASASMGATDVEDGRLGQAIRHAHRVVDAMAAGERIMLARMDRDVTALTDWSTDREALHAAINQLEALDSATDAGPLVQFARNAVRGLPQAQVVLVTDRAFAPPDPQLAAAIHLKIVPVGAESSDNVAVLDFNVRSHLGNALKYGVFYKLHNASKRPVKARVYVYSDPADTAQTRGDFLKLAPVRTPELHELAPGETKAVEHVAVSLEGRRAALVVEAVDVEDALAADDVAYAVVPQRKAVRVQLVGETNLFLEAALSTRSQVEVVRTTLAAYRSDEGFDLTVFDGPAPEKPGTGNQIFVNSATGAVPYKLGKRDRKGGRLVVPSSKRRHPLVRFVRFVDFEVQKLLPLKKRKGDVILARGKGGKPAILAHSTGDARWIAVGFDPIESEWVGHFSYAVFFVNAINWFFAEESKLLRPWSLAKRWSVPIPWKGLERVTITVPGGGQEVALVDGGGTLVYTGRSEGIYEVRHPDPPNDSMAQPVLVAAALKSIEEADLTPRGDYSVWQAPPAEATPREKINLLGADLWQLLVLLALGLMAIEWLSYHRRWTV